MDKLYAKAADDPTTMIAQPIAGCAFMNAMLFRLSSNFASHRKNIMKNAESES